MAPRNRVLLIEEVLKSIFFLSIEFEKSLPRSKIWFKKKMCFTFYSHVLPSSIFFTNEASMYTIKF